MSISSKNYILNLKKRLAEKYIFLSTALIEFRFPINYTVIYGKTYCK